MAELQIQALKSSESCPCLDEISLKIFETESMLSESSLSCEILLTINDITHEFTLELTNNNFTSKISVFFAPLMIESAFDINLQYDSNSQLFSLLEENSDSCLVIRVSNLAVKNPGDQKEIKMKPVGIQSNLIDYETFKENNAKYIENVVFGVDLKLKQYERLEFNNKSFEKIAADAKKTSNSLNESLVTALSACNKIIDSQNLTINNLQQELSSQLIQLQSERNKNKALVKALNEKSSEINDSSNKIHITESLQPLVTALRTEISDLKSFISKQQDSIDQLTSALKSEVISHESVLSSYDASLRSLTEENSLLSSQLSECKSQLQSLTSSASSLSTALSQASSASVSSDFYSTFTNLVDRYFHSPTAPTSSPQTLLTQVLNERSNIESLSGENSRLITKLATVQQELSTALDENLTQKEILSLMSINSSISASYSKISSLPTFTSDFSKILLELQQFNEAYKTIEERYCSEGERYFRKINRINARNLELHRLIQKIMRMMYDKNFEIYLLRNIAIDAQLEKKVYVPVRTDPIDICMAEFVNSRPTPLAIPLVREDQGIYVFNTRKIKVKIENNRVIVRLGGGFEGIEDFISLNMQAEIDKLEERRKFGAADTVKNMIDQDFTQLGIPSIVENLKVCDTSFTSTNSSFIQSTPIKKRPGLPIPKEVAKLVRKKTIS